MWIAVGKTCSYKPLVYFQAQLSWESEEASVLSVGHLVVVEGKSATEGGTEMDEVAKWCGVLNTERRVTRVW